MSAPTSVPVTVTEESVEAEPPDSISPVRWNDFETRHQTTPATARPTMASATRIMMKPETIFRMVLVLGSAFGAGRWMGAAAGSAGGGLAALAAAITPHGPHKAAPSCTSAPHLPQKLATPISLPRGPTRRD